jgi:hypothetical protein
MKFGGGIPRKGAGALDIVEQRAEFVFGLGDGADGVKQGVQANRDGAGGARFRGAGVCGRSGHFEPLWQLGLHHF